MTPEKKAPKKKLGGRPSAEDSVQIKTNILDIASELFLQHGYDGVSIESMAKTAGISKRTFYHRFKDKTELFTAVIHHLTETIRPPQETLSFEGMELEAILRQLAKIILTAALMPQALALYRLLLTQATRFPAMALIEAGSARQEAITRIAQLLEHEMHRGKLSKVDAKFLAEQFLNLIISPAQRRALGLGTRFTALEMDQWIANSVQLFLHGCKP